MAVGQISEQDSYIVIALDGEIDLETAPAVRKALLDHLKKGKNLLIDLAAGMRYLREEQGFERIVMLGNSGGGSLFAYYDAEARLPKGSRVSSRLYCSWLASSAGSRALHFRQ